MKQELIDVLACPVGKGNLELSMTQESGAEIVSGSLRCPHCQVLYPIGDGIPNLLPPGKAITNNGRRGV